MVWKMSQPQIHDGCRTDLNNLHVETMLHAQETWKKTSDESEGRREPFDESWLTQPTYLKFLGNVKSNLSHIDRKEDKISVVGRKLPLWKRMMTFFIVPLRETTTNHGCMTLRRENQSVEPASYKNVGGSMFQTFLRGNRKLRYS